MKGKNKFPESRVARLAAIESGQKYYHGSVHSCGNTERFVSSSACRGCTEQKTRNRSYSVDLKYRATDKAKIATKERRAKNRLLYNKRGRCYLHGITVEQFDKMFKDQNGRCYICNVAHQDNNQGLAIDHCHTTGKIRKLLCGKCNRGLGHVDESVEILEKMISYIKEHNASSSA